MLLLWQGSASTNSYELQRSYDGIKFNPVTLVPVQAGITSYSYHEREIVQQKEYYRVEQFLNGAAPAFSNTIEIRLPVTENRPLHILNNPVTSYIDLEIGIINDNGGSLQPAYASMRLSGCLICQEGNCLCRKSKSPFSSAYAFRLMIYPQVFILYR